MDVDELPHEPADLEDLHIPWSVLEDLVLRRAYLDGHSSTIELAEPLCVSPMVMEQAIEELRHNQLIDAVVAAQPNTVVVLMNGSAVTMPWAPAG